MQHDSVNMDKVVYLEFTRHGEAASLNIHMFKDTYTCLKMYNDFHK